VESAKIPVLMRGPASLISRVTPYNIRVEADLSSLMENLGSHFVSVKVSVPAVPGVGAVQDQGVPDYTVAIRLVEKED
jgi:hypothetical protein